MADVQEHYFQNPEPGKLYGNIQWRINKPDGDFSERSTVQRFLQKVRCKVVLPEACAPLGGALCSTWLRGDATRTTAPCCSMFCCLGRAAQGSVGQEQAGTA